MSQLDDARSTLVGAAIEITSGTWTEPALVRALCESARAYTAAYESQRAEAKPKATTSRSGQVVPFGKSQGVPIEEATTKDLRYLEGAIAGSVDDEGKAKWREKNVALLDAIRAELGTR